MNSNILIGCTILINVQFILAINFEQTMEEHAHNAIETVNCTKFEFALKAMTSFNQQKKIFLQAYLLRFNMNIEEKYKQTKAMCDKFSKRLALLSITMKDGQDKTLQDCLPDQVKRVLSEYVKSNNIPSDVIYWEPPFDENTQSVDKCIYYATVLALANNDISSFLQSTEHCKSLNPRMRDHIKRLADLSGTHFSTSNQINYTQPDPRPIRTTSRIFNRK